MEKARRSASQPYVPAVQGGKVCAVQVPEREGPTSVVIGAASEVALQPIPS